MSALPKAVQQQVDKANEIIKTMQENPDGIPPAVEAPPVVPDPPTEPIVAPAAADPPVAPPAEDPADHKYNVLKGKYNAEVPRLRKQLKEQDAVLVEMRQRMNNTESLLAGLHTQNQPPPAAVTSPPSSAVTEEEIAQFGPDLIDVIERVAARKIMPEIDSRFAASDTRFNRVEENASHSAHSVAISEREKVLDALTTAVPEWQTQNENEDFLQWLNEVDPYAGLPRGQLLTQAFNANDAARVIAFFRGFQTENATVTPEPPATPPINLAEPQQRLEDLVAPGTPKTGTTSAPNESGKRVWTRTDISTFYAKKNEFITKGKPIPEEYMKLERDLFAAQTEGRIR